MICSWQGVPVERLHRTHRKVIQGKPPSDDHVTLLERMDSTLDQLNKDRASRRRQRLAGVLILLAYVVLGSVFYTQVEGWTFGFAIYFCVVSTVLCMFFFS